MYLPPTITLPSLNTFLVRHKHDRICVMYARTLASHDAWTKKERGEGNIGDGNDDDVDDEESDRVCNREGSGSVTRKCRENPNPKDDVDDDDDEDTALNRFSFSNKDIEDEDDVDVDVDDDNDDNDDVTDDDNEDGIAACPG